MTQSISGIYQIRNTINGHRYVGSAVNIQSRWRGHRSDLKLGKHHSRYLQRAWDKYGPEAFEFSILELCFPWSLTAREQIWINKISPEYNIEQVAGSHFGTKASDEARANMSAAQTKRFSSQAERDKHSQATRGRVISDETKAKHSQRLTGRRLTPEWVENIRIGKEPYMRRVAQFRMDGKFIKEFESLAEAERQTGIARGNIRKHINGKFTHAGGYIWRYA